MLKYKVLANQLTSLADARFFAAQGVDWISFLLTPNHPTSVAPSELKEIKEWIEGPAIVGRFIKPFRKEIDDAITLYNLDAILLDEQTPLDVIQDGFSVTIFKEINVTKDSAWVKNLEWAAPFVDYFVLKTIEDKPDNQQAINELCDIYDIFLSEQKNNLSPQLIENLKPTGLVVNATGKEEIVGLKSFEELESLFEYLQNDPD